MDTKLLPHALEAEKSLLGAILNQPDVITRLDVLPQPSDFFLERNRLIFEAIYKLSDHGNIIDLVSVTETLQQSKALEKAGGPAYLAELTSSGMFSDNIEYYSKVIVEKSQRRQLIKNAHTTLESAYDESNEINYLLEKSEQDIFSITDRTKTSVYFLFQHFYEEFVNFIHNSKRKVGEYSGIPTGFERLDEMLTGLQQGELIVIGARPSVGKTAFALNIVHNIAIEHKVSAAFFSLEMSGRDIISRIVCMRSGIQGNKIRQNMLSTQDLSHISRSVGQIAEAPLYISDVTSMRLFDLRVQSRRLVMRENVKVVFIDYLGLIRSNDNVPKNISRFEQFSEISRSLKELARELHVPIVVLSQLNRDAEDKEPTLANIRESGAIEQDADVVLFLHRKSREEDHTTLIIAKQRNGPVGKVNFIFSPDKMKFQEIAR